MGRTMRSNVVSSSQPEWFSALRRKAFELASKLPPETNALYVKHYVPISYEVDQLLERTEVEVEPKLPDHYERMAEEYDGPIVIHLDGVTVYRKVPDSLASKGVVLLPLGEALERHGDLVKEALAKAYVDPAENKYLSLILATINSGFLLYVPRSVSEQVIVRSIWVSGSSGRASSGLTIIAADSQANLSIVEEHESIDGHAKDGKFLGQLTVSIAGMEATVKHALFNNLDEKTEVLGFRRSVTGQYAHHVWVGGLLGGSVSKYYVDNFAAGDGSRCDSLEVVMGNGSQKFDVTINLHHLASNTTGRVVAKGLGLDRSTTYFKGIIRIERAAKNSSAYLAEHAMLLSPEAMANAIPGLEVKSDNVKATHSASVSQLDQEHVWYLMSRGIPYEDAVKMLALGFFEPVISEIDVTNVRWNMRYHLERKWLGPRSTELRPEDLIDVYIEPEDVGKSVEDIFGTHYKYVYRRS